MAVSCSLSQIKIVCFEMWRDQQMDHSFLHIGHYFNFSIVYFENTIWCDGMKWSLCNKNNTWNCIAILLTATRKNCQRGNSQMITMVCVVVMRFKANIWYDGNLMWFICWNNGFQAIDTRYTPKDTNINVQMESTIKETA